jgi:hypothetical protein
VSARYKKSAVLPPSRKSPLRNPPRRSGEATKASSSVISRSQIVILKKGSNIKYLPYALTEQGVAMLSSVLRSPRAVQVNPPRREIMRAFVRLRQLLASHADLSRKLEALENKYDAQFKVVFDAIRQLMAPPRRKRRRIGFQPQ